MRSRQIANTLRNSSSRDGAVAVEAALVTPVLILVVLGAIDVGQFVNVGQTVNDASREGARRAVRASVTSTSDVESTVNSYIANSFPNVSSTALESATTITTKMISTNGTETTVTDLSTVPSGTAVSVTVTLQFDTVRWSRGFPGLTGRSISTTTRMRRE